MKEFEDEYTVDFSLDSLENCRFLFGDEEGPKIWKAITSSVENPSSSCTVSVVDVQNKTIWMG